MNTRDPEHVEVTVIVFRREDLLLATYNSNWESLTLPMTRRKALGATQQPGAETWEAAARRVVDEWFGPEVDVDLTLLADLEHIRQSDRDLRIREYHFRIFNARFTEDTSLRADGVAEWIPAAEISELYRRPISPTARLLIGELQKRGKLD